MEQKTTLIREGFANDFLLPLALVGNSLFFGVAPCTRELLKLVNYLTSTAF